MPRRRRPSVSAAAPTSLIAQRHSAIAWISGLLNYEAEDQQSGDESEVYVKEDGGLGVLIYPSLVLTTHNTAPSPAAIVNAEISLRYSDASLNILKRRLLPHLFFITSPDLNLTLVACEFVAPEMHPLGLDTSKVDNKSFDVGNKVYILGYDKQRGAAMKFSVGSGYIVSHVADFVEIRTRIESWMQGSAGFDQHGNFAFIITDCEDHHSNPSKSKGVTIQSIRDWLEPQWKVHKSVGDGNKERLSPQGLIYPRRATYAGPEASYTADACVREFDKRQQGNDGEEDRKKDFDDDRSFSDVHHKDKSPHVRVVDVGTGKPAIKKDAMKASNAKEKAVRTRKVASFSETASLNVIPPVRTSSGFEAKVILAMKDEKKKKGTLYQSKETERRRKPTLHKAFQQGRTSLQIRLTDLGKE